MDREDVRAARNLFREREENSCDPDEHLIFIELLKNDDKTS